MQIVVYECPICHNHTLTEIPPQAGDSHVITEVKKDTKEFFATTGLPVKLMGCTSCKTILMRNDQLEIQS